jgi:hypothetical protein
LHTLRLQHWRRNHRHPAKMPSGFSCGPGPQQQQSAARTQTPTMSGAAVIPVQERSAPPAMPRPWRSGTCLLWRHTCSHGPPPRGGERKRAALACDPPAPSKRHLVREGVCGGACGAGRAARVPPPRGWS